MYIEINDMTEIQCYVCNDKSTMRPGAGLASQLYARVLAALFIRFLYLSGLPGSSFDGPRVA